MNIIKKIHCYKDQMSLSYLFFLQCTKTELQQTVVQLFWLLSEHLMNDKAIFHVAQQLKYYGSLNARRNRQEAHFSCKLSHLVIKTHLQGPTDFHHIVLFYYCNSEVVGLHEFLEEGPVGFILTP